MRIKERLFGFESFHCDNCDEVLNSNYDSEVTGSNFFGPPTIKCKECGKTNRTKMMPYSQIRLDLKISYWFGKPLFSLIIWFIAAPSALIALIIRYILGREPSFTIILPIISVTMIFGFIYIVRRNIKMIKEIELEHARFFEELAKRRNL